MRLVAHSFGIGQAGPKSMENFDSNRLKNDHIFENSKGGKTGSSI